MKSITLKLTGFDELETFLIGARQKTKNIINNEFKDAANQMSALIKRDAPVNYGKLRNSIKYNVGNITNITIETASNYAPYMEFGTKSRFNAPSDLVSYASQFRGPTGISDVDPLILITAWVRRKGIVATYSIKTKKRDRRNKAEAIREKSAAFLIWRSIRKFGVKSHPYFFSDKQGNSRIPVFTKILINNISNGLKTIFGD